MKRPLLLLLISLALSSTASATITESHGYAQFGTLKYPARFTHFDWVNPQAPKGGTLRVMAFGTFDTVNPYTFKGTSPVTTPNFLQYGINELNEPLMVGTGQYSPSGDEPASSYGLIAQSVEYSEDRSWVVFNLRPEARFHDGTPITAYDVAFSYRTLLKEGHPLYRTALQEVLRVDILNKQRIRFVLKRSGNPLLILRLGELPVLPQHYWKDRDFKATTFEPPLGSGPYRITSVTPGRQLIFERVKDYWGKDLAVNRGKYNFDRMEVEFYRDSDVAFEAFKAGEFDIYIEHQAKNWANGYNFPADTPWRRDQGADPASDPDPESGPVHEHPPRYVRGRQDPRSAGPDVRLRVDQPRAVQRCLQTHHQLLPQQRIHRLRPAGRA